MSRLEHINPGNVPPYLPDGLSHAVAAEGGRTIHLSGQVGWNAASEPVGPDLASQLTQAHENIRRVLAAPHEPPTLSGGSRQGSPRPLSPWLSAPVDGLPVRDSIFPSARRRNTRPRRP